MIDVKVQNGYMLCFLKPVKTGYEKNELIGNECLEYSFNHFVAGRVVKARSDTGAGYRYKLSVVQV